METKTKDDKISEAIKRHGAFFAFGNNQFDEAKKEGVKYASLGMGLVCPKDNCEQLIKEINEIVKEHKAQAKASREARAKALKIDKLPRAERVQNRKILASEAISRVNNFADDCFIAEHYKMLENAKDESVPEVLASLLSAIAWRYHDRADYENDVKEVYDTNIQIIRELKSEVEAILKE